MESSFLCPIAICSWPLPTVDLTSSMCLSSLPGSEVCSVSCWANISGWSWNKELALAPHQPGISLALGLGRAVLPKTQPRTQSRGAPALPRPVHTAREHIHGGWHTSALSQALRGREPTGRGLPSSPQGGAPEVRVAWVPGGLTALPGRGHLGPGAGVTITTELSDLRGWPSLRGSLGLFPRHGEMVPA